MQIANRMPNGSSPSSGGGRPDIAGQLRRQRMYHRRTLLMRSVKFWWYRVLLVVLAGIVGINLGPVAMGSPILVCGAIIGLVIVFWAARRLQFGVLLAAAATTALGPKLISIKALDIYPIVPLLFLLLFVLTVQMIFHVRKPVLPSFRVIWPQLGLILMAIISTIMAQAFWTHGVPHKINGNPIWYSEVYGIGLFFFPLITMAVVSMILAQNERLVTYILRIDMLVAVIVACVVFVEFKRIGADLYSFRFSDPHIWWMSLRAIAQILSLGAIIGYVRFLYATRWRPRIIYGVITAMCLVAVILSLENSWWVEVGIALLTITVIYSRRLVLAALVALLPLLPLLKAELAKLNQVKQADYIRFLIWQDGLRVWSKQPLLGVGPGNFWEYDQTFTNLPRTLRNFNATGLGVAHNGYLQVLGELGPIGLFLQAAMILALLLVGVRLLMRSPVVMKRVGGFFGMIGLNLSSEESEKRDDRILALVTIGVVLGSAVADFFSGSFFLPARQVNSLQALPEPLTTWFILGCAVYKDAVWRMARRGVKLQDYIAPIQSISIMKRRKNT